MRNDAGRAVGRNVGREVAGAGQVGIGKVWLRTGRAQRRSGGGTLAPHDAQDIGVAGFAPLTESYPLVHLPDRVGAVLRLPLVLLVLCEKRVTLVIVGGRQVDLVRI